MTGFLLGKSLNINSMKYTRFSDGTRHILSHFNQFYFISFTPRRNTKFVKKIIKFLKLLKIKYDGCVGDWA